MAALTHTSAVHYYDTRLHAIPCGLRGFADRSTKHARSVTCESCIALLRDRRTPAAASASDAPAATAAP